jgi:hypothetical protein
MGQGKYHKPDEQYANINHGTPKKRLTQQLNRHHTLLALTGNLGSQLVSI